MDVLRACVLVDDAVHRRNYGQSLEASALRRYVIYQSGVVQWMLRLVVVVNLSLVLFEKPAVVAPFPAWLLLAIEAATLAVFAGQLAWIGSFVRLDRRLSSDPKHVGLALVILVTALDMAGWLIYGWRFTRILRVYFISYNSKFIRSAIRDIRRTIPAVLDVIVLLFFFIAVYSVFCTVLFLPLQDDVGYFASFWTGFTSMYVLRTTANFPDVMMPFYSQNRLAALVFIVFLCIATYLLTSLVLAVIYNKYRNHMKDEEALALALQRDALSQAFALLDADCRGSLDIDQWCVMMALLRPRFSLAKVHLLFRVLTSGGSAMHRHQFFNIVHLLNMHIETETPSHHYTWDPAMFAATASPTASLLSSLLGPALSHASRVRAASSRQGRAASLASLRSTASTTTSSRTTVQGSSSVTMRRLRALVQSRLFAYTVDALIVLNVVLVAVEVSSQRRHIPQEERTSEMVFSGLFFLEAVCKISAFGADFYFADGWNRFDFLLVSLTLSDIVVSLAFSSFFNNVFRYLLLLRVIRLWTTMGEIKRYRVLMSTLWQLLPALATYAVVQFMVFFVYAILGMALFGGLIHDGNPDLAGTVFADSGYFLNSFNDVGYAYVTLFELMVVNNWHVIAEGYVAASGTEAAWLYFISFNVIGALIIINIVIAFILEAFIIQWELNESRSKTPLENELESFVLNHHQYMAQFSQVSPESSTGTPDVVWSVKANHNIAYFLQHMFSAELAAEEAASEMFVLPNDVGASLRLHH
ncbi:two-pore calcium channel 3 [Thecamonas trahens ATCC 50062]|uniref:Two-pore calcium channel 3 n=1 Tax=Thecamonas trahens ATCC 50062 TaxID=461836 RepID=A0A0L0DDC3_THETB|nr:two-pore calcium channel 3 [Thecamonas trahens ATCC 50062]KNC50352.1 two-pore calcium channel 3 [Thecamonas trahens ATCC 50062]|eukprot:XP_013756896.1 two-pore calcium channel 3 [Thecamonas trahens ATCC 50062]